MGVNALGFYRGDDFLDTPHLGEVGFALLVENRSVDAHEVHAIICEFTEATKISNFLFNSLTSGQADEAREWYRWRGSNPHVN